MQVYANPKRFLDLSSAVLPWCAGATALLFAAGIYFSLFASPPDYQQGETVRIMYVHVPAAWMAMAAYVVMAVASLVGLVWRHPVAHLAARAAAPLGCAFTALALATGMLWGKPMWGTYWVWDARLTSVLVLFFLYLGYMGIWAAIEDFARAAKIAAVVALVGVVNIPIIRFSVDWWATLHQPASVIRMGGPTIHVDMLTPLLIMGLAYTMLFVTLHLVGIRTGIYRRRAHALKLRAAGA